jgi:hypothetical protein
MKDTENGYASNRSRDLSILNWKLVEAYEDHLEISIDFKKTEEVSERG